jgi:ubiquinone/menaquinone biosynthesis C-methylase UbiE
MYRKRAGDLFDARSPARFLEYGRKRIMDRPRSNLMFRGMSVMFKVRDRLQPRREILEEVGIKPGSRVLDYGCGPGGYVADTARQVGESGMVYALDVHPLAVRSVQSSAKKKHLPNVQTILSDCQTGLPDGSIDVVLLYDTFHALSDPDAVLAELHRVLKPNGTLSFSDHHMSEDEILYEVTGRHLFRLSRKGGRTYGFVKP